MRAFTTWLFQIQTTDEDDLRRGRTNIIVSLVMIILAILAIPISFLAENNPTSGITIISVGIIAYVSFG